jgi:ribosome-associated protein
MQTAQLCAEAADAKKAFNIVILDLRKLTYITDYFVICSGTSTTQVSAIAEEIERVLAKSGIHPSHVEGQPEATWVLMDYGDVVVHVFDEQTRSFYSLEKLWSESFRVPLAVRPVELKNVVS